MGFNPYQVLQSKIIPDRTPPTGAAGLRVFPSISQDQPEAPNMGAPDITDRMLQILSGNLGGTLTGGEKLSALGALLKSVSRGSQTSPQQVLQSIQKQKLGEVQGALQIQELRKAAAEKAQMDALKAEYISQLSQSNPQLARAIAIMPTEKFSDFIIQQNKPEAPTRFVFDQLNRPRNPYTGAIINPTAAGLGLQTIYGENDPNYEKLKSGEQYVDADGFIKEKS